ncbi:class I SAM-dependent methyltransferase [Streptomyces sp. NPDC093149]|uniref:class I SAM-dependent methyltransferase n=1 Tax=Streptomyces sp. NPDC093149 TaxID=3366031 RepID=UPI0037F8516A
MTDRPTGEHVLFEEVAHAYDQLPVEFFSSVGERLVRLAAVRPGDRVLDVGCGRGAVTVPAARAAGPTGSVLGIDLSPSMAEETGRLAQRSGLSWARTLVMDGQAPELAPAAFDAVAGSMSIHMLEDLPAAYRAYRTLLRPGGRLGLAAPATDVATGPGGHARVLGLRTIADMARTYTTDSGVYPNSESFGGQTRLYADLSQCGFSDVQLMVENAFIRAGSAYDVVRWTWTHGMRRLWERIELPHRAALEERIAVEIAADHVIDGQVVIPVPVLYATGVRPKE